MDNQIQEVIPGNIIDTPIYTVNTNIPSTSHAHDHPREHSFPIYSQIVGDDVQVCTLKKDDFKINKYILNNIL